MDPNRRSIGLEGNIQHMDIHSDPEDQVVPGSNEQQLFTSVGNSQQHERGDHAVPLQSTPINTLQGFMRTPGTRELSPAHSSERDSGYLSTPGAVGSDSHFYTTDIDGSVIQQYNVGNNSIEESKDGRRNEIDNTEVDCDLSDNDEGLTDDGDLENDSPVFYMADEDSYDLADGQQSPNLGNTSYNPSINSGHNHNNDESGAVGFSNNNLSFDNRDNMLSQEQYSQPMAIPKRRSHYLDNFSNSSYHSNVFHTPPRGYNQFTMRRGTASRSSTGSIQTLANPSSSHAQNFIEHARCFHESQLNQGRNRILNDEGNPRRARFFSESFGEGDDEQGAAAGSKSGAIEDTLIQPLRTRDRSLSAPAVMTLEKQFGQELRRISDDFDKEYQTLPNGHQGQNNHIRHGRNSSNRRSFPGTPQNDGGWWQKFIQWLPLTGEHDGMSRHRTEPVLHNLVLQEEEEEEEDTDEVDGSAQP